MATYVTVPGASGTVIVNPFNTPYNLQVANQIASILAVARSDGTLFSQNFTPSVPPPTLPAVPAGDIGEVTVTAPSGYIQVPTGYTFTSIGPTVAGGTTSTGPFVLSGGGSLFIGNQQIIYYGAPSGANTDYIAAGDGNNTFYLPGGATYDAALGNGNNTVFANGAGTVTGGTGDNLFFVDSATGTNVLNSFGTDTIIAGAGNTTVSTFGADPRLFGGSGNLVYIGGAAGAPTINGPTGSGQETLFGGAGQDITYFDGTNTTPGAAILAAGSGNETLNAGSSAYGVQLAAGVGSVDLIGSKGSDTFYGGAGAATMTGSGGSDQFLFGNTTGHTAGTDVITDWNSNDTFVTAGYGSSAAQNAVNAGTVSGGNFTVKLSDNTTIEFLGVTSSSQIHNKSF